MGCLIVARVGFPDLETFGITTRSWLITSVEYAEKTKERRAKARETWQPDTASKL